MQTTAITKLQQQLLTKVIEQIKAEQLEAGSSLNESSLAQQFEVSRTPMRAVLNHMAELGLVKAVAYKGFVLQRDADAIETRAHTSNDLETLYLRILIDLFFAQLDNSFSEAELQQRYNVNRGEVQSALRLLESDAILRRAPGYKWHLNGVLNTLERHTESYRCRLIFEPAGLLEPSWHLDQASLEACRDRHLAAISSPDNVSASELFTLSAEFHELLAACSGNRFLLSNMQQHNRMRKATDLVSMHIQSSVSKSCQRRLDILDLLLQGHNQAAVEKLTQLLENDIVIMQRTYSNIINLSAPERESLIQRLVGSH